MNTAAAEGFGSWKGPIFTNILLADEINRTPPKTQAALLQAMQEREVTVGRTTYELPEPFFTIATQNPIEQEGTYPAARKRSWTASCSTSRSDYPTAEEEEQDPLQRRVAMRRPEVTQGPQSAKAILNLQKLVQLGRGQ